MLVMVTVSPLITAGRGAFITEMISAAGGRSVTEDIPQRYRLQMDVESGPPRKPAYISC